MEKSYYKNYFDVLIGRKTNPSDNRSNLRRYYSRNIIIISIVLLIESALIHYEFKTDTITTFNIIMLSIVALGYFCSMVLLQPFIHEASINPARLFFDTVISMLFMICVCLHYGIENLVSSRLLRL